MSESIVVVGAALSADVDAPTERVHSNPLMPDACGSPPRSTNVQSSTVSDDRNSTPEWSTPFDSVRTELRQVTR